MPFAPGMTPRLLTGVILLMSGLSHAAEWEVRSRMAPAVTFTDNVCLSDDNKKSEWIGSVTPGLNVSGTGRRASLNFDGSLQFTTLDNNDTECENRGGTGNRGESPIPTLSFNGTSELIQNWFYFDASARARQNTINQFRGGGNDGLNRSGNINTSTQYQVNPYVSRRLNDLADVFLGYSYDEQKNSEDIVGDSEQQRADFSLSSIPGAGSIRWGLSGYWDKLDNDDRGELDQGDSELKSVSFNAGYRLDRTLELYGSVGVEDNDFLSAQDDIDGNFWDVGVTWTPNERTSLTVGSGDRFFGVTPRLDFSHRRKRSAILVSYSENLVYSRNLRTTASSSSLDTGEDGSVDLVEDLNGLGEPTSLSQGPILDQRLTVNFSVSGRRSDIGLSYTNSRQTRTDIDDKSEFNNASLRFGRQLGRGFGLSAGIQWDDREAGLDEQVGIATGDSETWLYSLGVNGAIGPNTSLSLDYVYTDRDSDLGSDSYKENRVTATLRLNL